MIPLPHAGALSLVFVATSIAVAQKTAPLLEARRGFESKLTKQETDEDPLAPPDERYFSLVEFETGIGAMRAYLGKPPKPGGEHPAIVWITGGFPPGGIGSDAWEPVPAGNDQSAKAYREAGLVMMYPTVRGSFGNPGVQESLLGEVDDVLAAIDHLAKVPYVDPKRIWLGGHSTGGALALLVAATAAAGERLAGVIAFGPVARPSDYGEESLTYDPSDAREDRMRSPIHFLGAIRVPTFVIEGDGGNIESLRELDEASDNPAVRFLTVRGADHFNLLAPVNARIAAKIAKLDAGSKLSLDATELEAACRSLRVAEREAEDLETLARVRRTGVDITQPRDVAHYLLSRQRKPLEAAGKAARAQGFRLDDIEKRQDRGGRDFYVLVARKKLALDDLAAVFAASKLMAELRAKHRLQYNGWSSQ